MQDVLSIFPQVRRGHNFYRLVLCCREDCAEEFLVDASKPITIHQIITAAQAAGWACDKRGYAVCPKHKNEPKQRILSPKQRRAAYVRIMLQEEAAKLRERQRERDFLNKRDEPKSWARARRRKKEVEQAAIVRKPTPVQNRLIVDELDTHYDLDNQRYKGNWSDQAIAEKLHVPRVWVSDLRAAICGPEGNDVQSEVLEKLEEYIQKCKKLENDALEIGARAESLEQEGIRLQQKLGLPVIPRKEAYQPAPSSRTAVIDSIAEIPTQRGTERIKGLYLTETRRQQLRDLCKEIIIKRNRPMQAQDIIDALTLQGVTLGSINKKAAMTRMLRLLHDGGQFDRIGNRARAYWWPRGVPQK